MSSTFTQIRQIDNRPRVLPIASFFLVAILILVGYWFFTGGSFRLYASLFFGLYFITKSSWLSIILVSVVQNIIFLPLRVLYEKFYPDLKKFEDELAATHHDDQSFLLNKKVREGNLSVIFYILNFVLLVIAFVSAGRVFLLEFYHTPISKSFLYDFIPYPQYPLGGIIFNFPHPVVTSTTAVSWNTIFWIWAVILVILASLRLLWRFLKPFLSGDPTILGMRISYNRLLVFLSGFVGTLLVLSTYFLRHIPTGLDWAFFTADLSQQNTTFNIITAVCTFLATIYSGFQTNREAAIEATQKGIPQDIIAKVARANIRNSIRNGLLLSLFALWITRLMPCSHDLSVLAFEFLYVISPLTFDLLIPKSPHRQA